MEGRIEGSLLKDRLFRQGGGVLGRRKVEKGTKGGD